MGAEGNGRVRSDAEPSSDEFDALVGLHRRERTWPAPSGP